MESIKKYIAEFIGTAVLVVGGCGTAVAINTITSQHAPIPTAATIIAISLAFGLSIVAMAYSIGNVSGCHINPAVSLGVLINGGMSVKDFCGYVIAQLLGATAGAAGLMLTFGSKSLGANGFGDASALHVGLRGAFTVEVILTFIFALTILGVTSKAENSKVAGLVIGLTLVFFYFIFFPFTGTSVNPARSFGPAIFQGGEALSQLWVFIVAPLLGAAIAAVVHRFVLSAKK